MDLLEVAHRDVVHAVRSFIRKHLASELEDEFIRMVKQNRSSGPYVFDHPNMARHAPLPLMRFTVTPMCYVIILDLVFLYEEYYFLLAVYLGSLGNPEITDFGLREYRTATNMTEQIAALIYNKWQHDYIICLIPYFPKSFGCEG